MQSIRRFHAAFVVMLCMIMAMAAFAGPASAAPYTTQATISVSTQTPGIGSSLRVCGTDFHASTRVTITLDNTFLSYAVSNTSGAFCKTVRLPDRVSGYHRVWSDDGHGRNASSLILILGPTATVGTRTPVVGSSLRVCGVRFHARTRVTISLDRRTGLGSVVSNSSGSFCKTVRLPARVLGVHAIWANDGHGRVASASIRIVRSGTAVAGVSLGAGATSSGGTTSGTSGGTASGGGATTSGGTASGTGNGGTGQLAFTGAALMGIGALAGLLILGGGLMLFSGRRRQTVS